MKSRHSKGGKISPVLRGGLTCVILALLLCAACASNPAGQKEESGHISSVRSENQVSAASTITAESRQASGQTFDQRLPEETGGAGSEQSGSGSGGAGWKESGPKPDEAGAREDGSGTGSAGWKEPGSGIDGPGEAESGSGGSEAGEVGPLSYAMPEAAEPLEIHFLDVGQGDSTLLLCGGEAMLIDAGGNDQGTKIQNYLLKQDVEGLKYVVCTHPDEDHIGGMDVILYKFDCETILMTEEERDTDTYRDVADTMWQRGYQRTLPVVGEQYTLGDAFFTILGPASIGSESNDNSVALLLTHGDNRFLFTGDAGEEEEAAIVGSGISLEADVYKVGHHGSRTSSSRNLLEAVAPAYAVISCEEGNSYGHPHAETMNQLRALGVQVYRTDEQGSIVVSSDGKELTWNCSPSETWLAGEPTGGSQGSTGDTYASVSAEGAQEMDGASVPGTVTAQIQDDRTETLDYICNKNTKKFHYPDCASVKKMKESNKLPVNAARDELISQGYVPCKNCNP